MPRPSKTDQEIGMLRSFWDTLGEVESEFNGATAMFVNRTRRPGVCGYRLVFTPLVGGTSNFLGSAAVQFEYPNGQAQTLAGAFWKAALDLQKVVDDAFVESLARPKKKG